MIVLEKVFHVSYPPVFLVKPVYLCRNYLGMSLPFGKNKNNRLLYYTKAIARELMPSWLFRIQLKSKLTPTHPFDAEYIKDRVNYYNKLSETRSLAGETDFHNKLSGIKIISGKSVPLSQFKLRNVQKKRVYYFDSYEYTRYFDPKLKLHYMFGDVTAIPDEPTIVKSRPVRGNNANSVVLNLEKFRHFLFLNDSRKFSEKKNMLVGRAVVKQPHRIRFFEKYFGHPLCNLGQTNKKPNPQWIKNWLSIADHLEYKFILCIEGNDVATNLKWVMSSNSLAVMPRPTYETWFMEGKLIPDYHYVAIKDDYSDLEERLSYYIHHPEEAQKIIDNAHAFIDQFKNNTREEYISLLVLEKYFYRTGQLTPISNPNLFV